MSGFQHDEHPFPGLDMGEQIDAFRPGTAYQEAGALHEAALMGEVGLTEADFNEVLYLRTYRAVAPLYGPAGDVEARIEALFEREFVGGSNHG